ncbi:hypothetical protein ACTXGQ_15970 [Marinobacter sp. 1Y8]
MTDRLASRYPGSIKLTAAITLLAILAGCGDGEPEDRPIDGRDTDGFYEPSVGTYSGRVIDGYLKNARVWLDLDGDYQYDSNQVEVTVGQNPERTIVIASGEPTAMTGDGGVFSLDMTPFSLDPETSAELNPADYPLVAVAIPGVTEEETYNGNVTVSHAFMLSASPGENNVTPLSTLIDVRRQLGIGELNVNEGLALALANINMQGDYIRSGDDRAHAYARVLTRFLAQQFPDEYESAVAQSEGRIAVFNADAMRIVNLSIAGSAEKIVRAVDDAVSSGGSYANVDTDKVAIPDVPLDLENPILLKGVTLHTSTLDSGVTESTIEDGESISTDLVFQYDEMGVLEKVSADGCMLPSPYEIARLANVKGQVSKLDVQSFDGYYLKTGTSRPFWEDDKVNETLTFDWATQRAYFRTTTTCHPGLAATSEIGDSTQLVFGWTLSGEGKVEAMTVSSGGAAPGDDGDALANFSPDYTYAYDPVFGFDLSVVDPAVGLLGDTASKTTTITGGIVECLGAITPENLPKPRVISAQQSYEYTNSNANAMDAGVVPADGSLKIDWDTRDGHKRLLRRIFYDPTVNTVELLQWEYSHVRAGDFVDEVQPNLINEAQLSRKTGSLTSTCGYPASGASAGIYALARYDYIRLADYTAENL